MERIREVEFSAEDILMIKVFLENKEGITIEVEPQMSGLWFRDEARKMELRLLLLADYPLTVSRVMFIHKRPGIMTQLLDILEDFCIRNSVKDILVQSVGTAEMAARCHKNGFTPDLGTSFVKRGTTLGDYRKKIVRHAL